jgi:hypothetical protein
MTHTSYAEFDHWLADLEAMQDIPAWFTEAVPAQADEDFLDQWAKETALLAAPDNAA